MTTIMGRCARQLRSLQSVCQNCTNAHHRRQLSRMSLPMAKLREKLSQYDGGSVDLHKDETSGLATITLNNPDRMNALTGKMIVDFDDCVRDLENWNTGKGVILTGKGSAFCSGGDLNFVKHFMDGEKGYEMSTMMHDVTMRLLNLPLISVAAISGHALGGGAELTTACDFRVMSQKAKIGFVQVKLHVAPGWGGATRLVNILGRNKALQILASGKIITADLGRDVGLVDEIAPDGADTLDHSKKWLSDVCVGAPAVSGVIKSMVIAASSLDTMKSLEMERHMFARVWGSPAHQEAVGKKSKQV